MKSISLTHIRYMCKRESDGCWAPRRERGEILYTIVGCFDEPLQFFYCYCQSLGD
jgi:hypothetical protein